MTLEEKETASELINWQPEQWKKSPNSKGKAAVFESRFFLFCFVSICQGLTQGHVELKS